MKEELEKIYKELETELKKIKPTSNGKLNNKSNKIYHQLEHKYKNKIDKVREKYSTQK